MIITIQVEVEKVSGPFASREAIGEEIISMVDGQVSVSGVSSDSEYEILNVEVVAS